MYMHEKWALLSRRALSHFKKQIKKTDQVNRGASGLPAYRPTSLLNTTPAWRRIGPTPDHRDVGRRGALRPLCRGQQARPRYTSLIPTPARAKSSRVGSQSGRSRTAEPGTTTVASTSGRSHFAVRVDVPSPPITRFSLSPKRM